MKLGSWHKTTAFDLLDFAISQKSLTFCSATGKPNFWQEKQVGQSFLPPLLLPHAFLQNLRKNPTSSLSQQLDKKRIRLGWYPSYPAIFLSWLKILSPSNITSGAHQFWLSYSSCEQYLGYGPCVCVGLYGKHLNLCRWYSSHLGKGSQVS